MVRKKLLSGVTALAVLLGALVSVSAANASGVSCTPAEMLANACPSVGGSVGDGGVDLIGSVTNPGSGGSGSGLGSGGIGLPLNPPPPPPPLRDGYSVTPAPSTPPAPSVTLTDLINFRPAPGVLQMEPDGWMVVDLDTNFYTRVTTAVQSGSLLGQPASVRFTPVQYHWSYGDGATRTGSTRGDTWASSGAAEFDPTPTSHIYRAAGTYDIDLTIDFAAEYRFAGGSWIPLAGTVPSATNRLTATAGDANTVLVARNCREDAAAAGC